MKVPPPKPRRTLLSHPLRYLLAGAAAPKAAKPTPPEPPRYPRPRRPHE